MLPEITYGVNFLRRLLESKFSADQLEKFSSNLTALLKERYCGHWKPNQPTHGNAYRSIHTTADKMDPVIRSAAELAEMPGKSIMAALPCSLTLWIDPFEVSYRIGSNGSICHNKVDAEVAAPVTTAPSKGCVISHTNANTVEITTATPPSSPARTLTPRTPLLPLPLTRRPSEAGFAPQSPPQVRSRTVSRDLLFSPQRRMSAAGMEPPALPRSPSRADVYIGYDHSGSARASETSELGSVPERGVVPQSPRRRSNLELMANMAQPLVLSH